MFGAVAVAAAPDRLSKVAVGPGPSYGSSDAGGILSNLIISCDKPIGLFGVVVDLADGCEPVRVPVEVEVLGRACGPVLALGEVLGAVGVVVGKKLSDVSMTGENLIFVCLSAFHASLHDSFSTFSSSEL